jgi:low temperature requirement protein LtrA
MLSCLAGVITAVLSLRHFDEYKAALLAITQRDYPTETAATQEQVATAGVGVLLGAGMLVVVLQLVFSLAMRSGRNWARFVLVLIGGVGLFYAFLVVNSVSFDIKVSIGAAAGLAVVGVLAMFLPGTGKWFERDRGRISPPIRPG